MLFIIILIPLLLQTLNQQKIDQHPKAPNKLALYLNELRLQQSKQLMICMRTCFKIYKKRTNVLLIIIGHCSFF
jgi:hypothetical protein